MLWRCLVNRDESVHIRCLTAKSKLRVSVWPVRPIGCRTNQRPGIEIKRLRFVLAYCCVWWLRCPISVTNEVSGVRHRNTGWSSSQTEHPMETSTMNLSPQGSPWSPKRPPSCWSLPGRARWVSPDNSIPFTPCHFKWFSYSEHPKIPLVVLLYSAIPSYDLKPTLGGGLISTLSNSHSV